MIMLFHLVGLLTMFLVVILYGCTDPNAFNYDPDAGVDDGSCIDESNQLIGCMDENYLEYDENANINNSNLCITPVVLGCTDINAINYNPVANVDDDSCFITDRWMYRSIC